MMTSLLFLLWFRCIGVSYGFELTTCYLTVEDHHGYLMCVKLAALPHGHGEVENILATVVAVARNIVVDVCHSCRACAISLASSTCHQLWLLGMTTASVMLVVDFAHDGGSFGCP
jgi:NifU-like protein involved in Fe-S cluster formation